MIEGKLYSVLSGATTITNITSTRIYPVAMNQAGTYPSISYERTQTDRQNTLSGYGTLERVGINVNVYATALDTLHNLSSAVIKTVENSTRFQALVRNKSDLYEDRLRLRKRTIEFSIWNKE